MDYLLSYENNTAFGTGKVIVTGIVNYRGVVERTFEIVKKAPELSAVYIQSQPGKTVYKSGETFDPTGLSLMIQRKNWYIAKKPQDCSVLNQVWILHLQKK